MFQKNIFYSSFLKISLLFLIFFSFFNISHGAEVNAGLDQTISIGDSVTLNGSITGFDSCREYFTNWYVIDGPKELYIDPSQELTGSLIAGTETDTIGEYYIKLDILGRYCGDDEEDIGRSDIMILNINGTSNQTPTDIIITSDNINENNNSGDTVGSFSTIDPDDPSQADVYKYYLVSGAGDDDNNIFSIENGTLLLKG